MSFIVVGIDGSDTAQRALEAAVEQARRSDAEVRAVNVVVLPAMTGYEYGPIDVEAMKVAGKNIAANAIDEVEKSYDGSLPVSVSTTVVTGHVGIELMRAAKADEGASMVVVGSRGMGGFKSLLLGSVTTYLSHHLSCPLLIIPADE